MFGYLKPDALELKVADWRLYRGVYCGLCCTLRQRYGQLTRFVLQYDMAVLTLLWMGLSQQPPTTVKRMCAPHPLHFHPSVEGHPALDAAADLSLLLARRTLQDKVLDDGSRSAAAANWALRRATRKAAGRLPDTAQALDARLEALHRLEQGRSPDMDAVSDLSGRMLQEMARALPVDAAYTDALDWMTYQMGRWLYLVDALDDQDKDEDRGSYNPLRYAPGVREDVRRLAYDNGTYAASQAAAAFDLLPCGLGHDILHNVLYAGMPAALEKAYRHPASPRGKEKQPVEESV